MYTIVPFESYNKHNIKRFFDIVFSFMLLLLLGWMILILILRAYFDCGRGLFLQTRIGQYGKPFTIFKIRSMHSVSGHISEYGKFLRRYKLDELPQLLNIFQGEMSFVGPRPDIPGYYDELQGEPRKILQLKPGLCSWAAIKYFNEDEILKLQKDALEYNDKVIFPDKVRMNLKYYYTQSFSEDIRILWKTIFR